MGRWLNPDPAGTVDGLNVYNYVSNRPISLIDPNGKSEKPPDWIINYKLPNIWDLAPPESEKNETIWALTEKDVQNTIRYENEQAAIAKEQAAVQLSMDISQTSLFGSVFIGASNLAGNDPVDTAVLGSLGMSLDAVAVMGAPRVGAAFRNRLPTVKPAPQTTTLVTVPNIMHIGGMDKAQKNPINNSTGEGNQTNCIACSAAYIASYLVEPVAPLSDITPGPGSRGSSWVTANDVTAVAGQVGLANRIEKSGDAAVYVQTALNGLSGQGALTANFRLTTPTAVWRNIEPSSTNRTDLFLIIMNRGTYGGHAVVGIVGTFNGRTQRTIFDPQNWRYVPEQEVPEGISFFRVERQQ